MAQTIKLKRSATQGASPTTSQLALGEVAINTYDGKMYIKKNDGTESIVEIGAGGGSGSGLSSSFTLYEYTATASQTTFSGSDSNSNTLAYDTGTPPKILVYLNGVLLDHTTDYTATSGTSVVLTNGAATSDLLQIAAYKSEASVALDIDLADNVKLQFGNDDDLQIYHNGSNSYIVENGTGDLFLGATNLRLTNGSVASTYLQGIDGGAVDIRHNNSVKLATTSTGIDVTGTATMDGLTVDGSATIDGGASVNTVLTLDSSTANTYLKITDSNSTNGTFIGATTNDLNFYPNNTLSAKFASGGDVSFYEDTGTTAKLFWDASNEGLGLGTTSPATGYRLDILGNSGYDDIMRITGVGTNIGPRINLTPTGTGISRINATANSLQLQTVGTAAVTIDSSQNVGIGTSSPATPLDVLGEALIQGRLQITSSAPEVLFSVPSGGLDSRIHNDGSGNFIFGTGTNSTTPTERMRITSGGHLLVGKTSQDATNTVGAELKNTGELVVTTDGTAAAYFNRKTSDGTIAEFRKDNSAVGSIGSNLGRFYIHNNYGSGSGFRFDNAAIRPSDSSGASEDATTDLGASAARFKDLYLSNQAYASYFGSNSDADTYMRFAGSNITLWNNGGSESMRLDSSGNLLVGTTSQISSGKISVAGGTSANGITATTAATAGYAAASFQRTASDGDLISFKKGTTTVGSIGTNGDYPYFANTTRGIKMVGSAMFPTYGSGTTAPDLVDIGGTSSKFKDLHLSGQVNTGTISSGNITTTGYLRGPSTFTIDPAAHGDDTGTVVIAGNLQVDGTTTTINSTTLTVDDKNITLASGSANAAAANGAGLTVDCGSSTDATFTYDGTNDEWDLNKRTKITSSTTSAILELSGSATTVFQQIDNTNASGLYSYLQLGTSGRGEGSGYIIKNSGTGNGLSLGSLYLWNDGGTNDIIEFVPNGTIANRTSIMENGDLIVRGNVGIGTTSPTNPMTIDFAPTAIGSIGIANNSSAWNTSSSLFLKGASGSNGLGFGVSGTANDRKSWIQSGHPDQQYANYVGTLAINPLGGNVGIGTSSPASILNVYTDAGRDFRVDHGTANRTILSTDRGMVVKAGAGYSLDLDTGSTNGTIRFLDSGVVHSIFDASGNLGIGTGTSSPARKLEVKTGNEGYVARFKGSTSAVDIFAGNTGSFTGGLITTPTNIPLGLSTNTGTGVLIIATNNNVGIGTASPSAKLQIEDAGIDTTSTSTTATTQVAIDTFAAATFRSARYTIQVTNSTDSTYHLTEVLLIHDGTTPQITEYGTIFTGSAEATFDADISSGNVRLLATPATTDSMTFKVVRHCITV